jgi:hypothetical protein
VFASARFNGADVGTLGIEVGEILSIGGNSAVRQLILGRVEHHLAFDHMKTWRDWRGFIPIVGEAQDDQQHS